MATYFGQQNHATEDYLTALQYSYWNSSGYSCAGSGNQVVQELSVWADLDSGSSNIRLAIYNSSGTTLIGYGTSEVATTTTAGWQGHMSQSAVQAAGGGSCVLTGGTTYLLVVATDGDPSNIIFGWQTINSVRMKGADWTGGFPSSLTYDLDYPGYDIAVRCGVDPETSSGNPWYYYAQQMRQKLEEKLKRRILIPGFADCVRYGYQR